MFGLDHLCSIITDQPFYPQPTPQLIPKQVIDGFLEAMRKKAGSAVSFNQVEDAVTLITLAGYSASQLVFQVRTRMGQPLNPAG